MTTATPAGAGLDEAPVRKLYRSAEGRWLGGVAQGLAGHLALPVSWVRIFFIGLLLSNGLGVLLYGIFWFVVPLGAAAAKPVAPRRRLFQRPDRGQLIAGLVCAATLGVLAANVQFPIRGGYLWPMLIIGVGAAVVWRQADNSRRAHWAEATRRSRWLPLARTGAGVALVCGGVGAFVVGRSASGDGKGLALVAQASVALLVGLALMVGPYVVRMVQDLSEERTMRIRAQERAEVAAHIHDSVLHTLTLIQRNAERPREVARLARAQERDLRAWLYKSAERQAQPDEDDEPGTFAESVRSTVAEVEDHHGVPIEVVCVGDCPLDEPLLSLLQAAREAMVNAAKYGGEGGPVRVFAEVEGRTVFVSVRDRGPGFDPDAVPDDRMGVRESIIGRMQRNGGRARVRSTPGEGTEVELTMERSE
ncbi:PspC domain-containing protein [Streptomyces radicis]|uniref:ATP-binding protein n=1 Tax=Streptomyces radicis TaxID=1750517 RepID=A0A3A9W499_9ACTN|nr:PspC domain-containing protein [Streptomyces radicis]RKN08065.1 ATP-binding protein [Streptomyces radicis]RKN20420.1 ATP-binding protein [Streptomyces radicis]